MENHSRGDRSDCTAAPQCHAFRDGELRSTLIDDTTGDQVPTLRLVNAQKIGLDAANTHVRKIGHD